MRLPSDQSVSRRGALARTLLTFAASSLPALAPPSAALAAAYTIIPSGTVAEKQSRLTELKKQIAKASGEDRFVDPYLEGESLQLEFDIGQLRRNSDFAASISRDVADGKTAFPTSLRVAVPDMASAVKFWQKGAGALVLSTRLDADGSNVTRIGYGSQSFKKEDGAKFALELVQPRGGKAAPFDPEGSVLQYLQLALPVFRLSQVMANGGEVVSAFGWTELTAPGGLPLRVRIDDTRRDPFEFVALRASEMDKAQAHYTALGMTAVAKQESGAKFKLGGSYGVYRESGDAFEPDREPGTVQMNFVRDGNAKASADGTTGILLLPPKKRGAKLAVGTPPTQLTVVGSVPAGGAVASPDGLRNEYVGVEAFEASFSGVGAQVGKSASLMDDGFEGVLSRDVPQ